MRKSETGKQIPLSQGRADHSFLLRRDNRYRLCYLFLSPKERCTAGNDVPDRYGFFPHKKSRNGTRRGAIWRRCALRNCTCCATCQQHVTSFGITVGPFLLSSASLIPTALAPQFVKFESPLSQLHSGGSASQLMMSELGFAFALLQTARPKSMLVLVKSLTLRARSEDGILQDHLLLR